MVRSWLLRSLLGLWVISGLPGVDPLAPPQVQAARWVQTELTDWLPGSFINTYVEGSELRLQPDRLSGEYRSAPFRAAFGFNGVVVETLLQATPAQTLTVELRGSLDGQQWLAWQPVGRVMQVNDRTLSPFIAFQPVATWLQYRVHFGATVASPKLDEIAITYLNTMAGPSLVDLVARSPLAGPSTLTPPPNAIIRKDWSGGSMLPLLERQQPRHIEISQIQVSSDDPNSAATLRALQWVATNRYGQADLPFHYLLDGHGIVLEGQSSASVRLGGSETGTVRIGLLTDAEHEGVSEAVDAQLTALLAWLGEAYSIAPAAISVTQDAPAKLHERLTEYQAAAERETVRWRRFFPEGSPGNGLERLVLLNTNEGEAHATLIGYTATGRQQASLIIPPQQQVEVTLNTTFPGGDVLGLQVLADRPLVGERTQIVQHEMLTSTGVATPLHTWYFAAGDTTDGTQTYLLIINTATITAAAELTFYFEDGTPLTKTVALTPQVRSTVLLNDLLPNRHFAVKLNATEPVVAERSIFTTAGAASLGVGLERLSRRWLFAEGTTTSGYTTTLYVLNPWPQQIAITVQVLSEDGTTVSRRYAVPGVALLSLAINEIAPDVPFALDIQADRPLALERGLIFGDGQGATIGSGTASPQTRWTFAGSSMDPPAEQFLLVANPGPAPVSLDFSYTLPDGSTRHHIRTMPGTSRLTIGVANDVPDQSVLSTTVIADRPVVVERSLYIHSAAGLGGETTLGLGGP